MAKILVVEDDPMIRKTIEFKLNKSGYETEVAEDGQQGLEMVDDQVYDLLITDVMMPYITGLELVEKVKKKLPNLPILLLSAVGHEDMVLKAFDLGADDYMKKPFSPNELLIRVKKLLR